jgi:SAM-dependent methyltransferase
MLKSKNFYNEISGFYDKMISFEKNLELRISAYKNIFGSPKEIADIGCGIGLDSITLALNGHSVTSFDVSPEMIKHTKSNAEKYNVNINANVSSFESIPKKYFGKFDAVVSVGNTIAHLTKPELKSAFKKIYTMLKPSGKVMLHILNYDLIIRRNKRINNIAHKDGLIIIRFYDFYKSHLNFNILSFREETPKDYSLVTTKHFPHSAAIIKSYAQYGKFSKINFYGTFDLDKFDRKESKDIFILLQKKL